MAKKKYAKDYRLSESLNERGRIRTEAEYIGAYYRYSAGYAEARAQISRILLITAIGCVLFLSG